MRALAAGQGRGPAINNRFRVPPHATSRGPVILQAGAPQVSLQVGACRCTALLWAGRNEVHLGARGRNNPLRLLSGGN